MEECDVSLVSHRFSVRHGNARINAVTTTSADSGSTVIIPETEPSFTTFEGRYRKAKHVCDDIVNFLSVVGMVEFTEKIHHLEHLLQLWCSPVDENESLMATNRTAARVVTLDPPLSPECTTGTATAAVTNTAIIPVTEQGVSPECFASTASSTVTNTATIPVTEQSVSPECFASTASSTVTNTALIPASMQGVSPECTVGTASTKVTNTAFIQLQCKVFHLSAQQAQTLPLSQLQCKVFHLSAQQALPQPQSQTLPSPQLQCKVFHLSAQQAQTLPLSQLQCKMFQLSVLQALQPPQSQTLPLSQITAVTVVTLDPPLGPNTVITLDVPPECSPYAESWPKMDKIPKHRGRPCTKQNFTQRKIALKRKRTCPKKFADLTEEAKIFLIIRATCTYTDTSTVITESCLKPVADFGDLVMDDRVDIEMVRPFFDTRAFSKLQYGVLNRKRDGPFSCGKCHA
ncbi:hypothetical protein EGW08_010603 [Elysia chlorotica]|uniref:Uncharacterized protein n=1 Tax=Elysia chlorotica TaxID=188477 RepID=A0A3S0ZSG8_ELYCH|nr:hypothetical protein EGW08_010603 [Elysia chlorotica]